MTGPGAAGTSAAEPSSACAAAAAAAAAAASAVLACCQLRTHIDYYSHMLLFRFVISFYFYESITIYCHRQVSDCSFSLLAPKMMNFDYLCCLSVWL